MTTQQQISVIIFGMLTFHGSDYNIISLSVITLVLIFSRKQSQPKPCKVYDFMAEKQKRNTMKRKVSYQKAA